MINYVLLSQIFSATEQTVEDMLQFAAEKILPIMQRSIRKMAITAKNLKIDQARQVYHVVRAPVEDQNGVNIMGELCCISSDTPTVNQKRTKMYQDAYKNGRDVTDAEPDINKYILRYCFVNYKSLVTVEEADKLNVPDVHRHTDFLAEDMQGKMPAGYVLIPFFVDDDADGNLYTLPSTVSSVLELDKKDPNGTLLKALIACSSDSTKYRHSINVKK